MSGAWISVIIPVYNGGETLEDTLSSLLGQADGVEVILIDQGSHDASRAIAVRFQDRLDLKIIDAPENENWLQNTNLGFTQATAPYISMLHQDDMWVAGRAKVAKALLKTYPQARLWAHSAWYVDSAGTRVGKFEPPFGKVERLIETQDAISHLIVQNTIALPAVIFRRDDALELNGLDEGLWYTADWDFWLHLARLGPIAWSPSPVAEFRIHKNSQTITGSKNAASFAQQLAIPLSRHLDALPSDLSTVVAPVARVSGRVNLCLAQRYNGQRSDTAAVLLALVALGPRGWWRFFRDTKIFQRIVPRLRLVKSKKELS